jgi:glycosyltransferase involved in cell wall biosynthesis
MEAGGIETLIFEFAHRLNGSEILPSIGVFKEGGYLEENLKSKGISFYNFDKKEGIDILLIYKLRKLLKKENIRILHTHNYAAWLYGVLSTRGVKGLKHIHTEHSNVEAKRRALAEKFLSHFTDRIVCVSEDVKKSMIENQGISPERLIVIYNGVDTEKFYPDPAIKRTGRKALGIKENVPVIGIVARLTPVKDHVTLLKAFKIILKKYPEALLLIVGDGELREGLIRQSVEMKIKKNVLFLGERYDIPELLNVMDIFVLSSISEGHNISLIEAMSTGLPTVVTNVGGNKEVVLDGVNGYLVSTGNPQGFADKIINLLENQSLRNKMGRKSRERVIERFSLDRMLKDYKALYLKLGQFI